MKYLKRFLLVLLLVSLLLLGGFVFWASMSAQPGQAALKALVSDETVTVTQSDSYIVFQPATHSADLSVQAGQAAQPAIGLIFYPGGRVDYRAYAPALRQIAAQGCLVVLVPVRLNLAFFDIDAGLSALRDFPQITTWAAGGHSLGGVAASIFAQNHPEVRGVVFWASYPADERFRATGLPALSVYGTLDGLAGPDRIDQSRALLPETARFVRIEGGNHAQFGDYGSQPGDLPATISPEEQWTQIARATAEFLQSLTP
jgi:pimeloyl-ACP methyl ester carboxylesterase